ncbi:hypothetical protein [Roseiarcus sp.]|uniref:hypothetical protein n=1 Tax=Roseiarcus sp. TaxID=1969460 RepID=UPI003D12C743
MNNALDTLRAGTKSHAALSARACAVLTPMISYLGRDYRQDSPQPLQKSRFAEEKTWNLLPFPLELPSFSFENAYSDLENNSLKR